MGNNREILAKFAMKVWDLIKVKENIQDIRKVLEDTKVRLKIQYEQLGTGHAVISAMPCCDKSENMLILLD